MWIGIALAAIVLVLIALVVVIWQAQRRWQSATSEMQRRLHAAAATSNVTHYSEAELAGLPSPLGRYFRAVLKDGQPIIRRAHVSWKGEFNMGKPGADRWVAFSAEQDFVPSAPGFVWDARIRMAPGMNTLVRDGFAGGAGSMLAKVLGLITVANSHDTPAIAVGALQRYLGEAAWLPTALLPSQGVTWEPMDDTRARATISGGGVKASLEFRFGADGLIASAYARERVFDDGKNPPSPHPWQARNLRHGEFNGIKVPVDATVEWLFLTGAYAYWRGQPVKIEYEYETASAARQQALHDMLTIFALQIIAPFVALAGCFSRSDQRKEFSMDQEQKRVQAQQRVARLKGFYGHVATYAVVMTMLFLINYISGGPWWFYWPLLGWGIGVALHALGVFGLDRAFGSEWEQKKIDEFMKRG